MNNELLNATEVVTDSVEEAASNAVMNGLTLKQKVVMFVAGTVTGIATTLAAKPIIKAIRNKVAKAKAKKAEESYDAEVEED